MTAIFLIKINGSNGGSYEKNSEVFAIGVFVYNIYQ